MEEKQVKESVDEVVQDLKNKVEEISVAGKDTNNAKIEELKNKAISTLNLAIDRISNAAEEMINSEEVAKGVEFVKVKSKDLYEATLKKIEEIKNSKEVNDAVNNVGEYVKDASKKITEAVNDSEIIQNAKQTVTEFVNSKEVKEAVDKAKHGTVDLAEKALETLKGWLDTEDK